MKTQVFRVLESLHQGYGDARRVRRKFSYNRCFGSIDPTVPGEIRAGYRIRTIDYGADDLRQDRVCAIVEWTDASSTNEPMILITGDVSGAAGKTLKYQHGVITLDGTLADVPVHAALHDDGSGTGYYYTCYVNGSTKIQRRHRDGTLTTFTNLNARRLLSLQGDLYLVVTVGTLGYNNAVAKIPQGTAITLALAQPAGTLVGWANTHINTLTHCQRSVVVCKPEGIYIYDRGLDKWVNKAPWLELSPHADTGKVTWHEGTDLIVGLGFGGALRFDGEVVEGHELLDAGATPNLDTTAQVVQAAAAMRQGAIVLTQACAKLNQEAGGDSGAASPLIFAKSPDTGATWATDYGAEVRNLDPTDAANLDALASATGRMLVGFPEPFYGFRAMLLFNTQANNNVAAMSARISTAGGFQAIAIVDGTTLETGESLGTRGNVLFDADPILAGWVPTAITIAGVSRTRYWMELAWSADLSATVRIQSMEIIPWRPSIAGSGDGADWDAAFGKDGWDRAGVLPHVLLSGRDSLGQHVVHDLGCLPEPEVTKAMLHGVMAGAGGTNNHLVRAGFRHGVLIAAPTKLYIIDRPLHDAALDEWPTLHDKGLIELPFVDLEGYTRVQEVRLDGRDWHAIGYAWFRYDDGHPWQKLQTFNELPVVIPVVGGGHGRRAQIALGYVMTSAQQMAPGTPTITDVEFVATDDHADATPLRLPRKSPAVV